MLEMMASRFKRKDVEHGRTWTIECERTVTGYSYRVTIGTYPQSVAYGWCEGDMVRSPQKLLEGVMIGLGATPGELGEPYEYEPGHIDGPHTGDWIGIEGELARLPGPLPAERVKILRSLVDRAQTAMIRECQEVARSIEEGAVTTCYTVAEALKAMADGRK